MNEFRARMFASYFGCDCQVIFGGKITRTVKVDGYFLANLRHHPKNHSHEYKLVLSSPSALTDEHEIAILRIIHKDSHRYGVVNGKHVINNMKYSDLPIKLAIEIGDYLRLNGYDCGFADIPSLINDGFAVEAVNNAI